MNFMKRQHLKLDALIRTYLIKDSNTKKWESYENKFKGKRVFLIGNGPSLNETPMHLLENEFTMCFNRFYLMQERLNWHPSFYMCTDPLVVPDIHEDINNYIKNIDYSFFQKIHKEYISETAGNISWIVEFNPFKFRYKLPLVSRGDQTVAIFALQILMYLGFSEIYLIGVDQNYSLHTTAKEIKGRKIISQSDDDPNHFDPRYFGKGRKYHQPDKWMRDRMLEGFKKAKISADQNGIKIFNAGYGGMLEVFPRVNFKSLFNLNENKELILLANAIGNKIDINKLDRIFKDDLPDIEEFDNNNLEIEIFTLNLNSSLEKIKDFAFTHIPFGPYCNRHLFILRSKKEEIISKYFQK
jgi:hypothetical protein